MCIRKFTNNRNSPQAILMELPSQSHVLARGQYYRTGIKFRGVFNFADFVGDFSTTKINTMEMLTAHAQYVKINDLMQVHVQKCEI